LKQLKTVYFLRPTLVQENQLSCGYFKGDTKKRLAVLSTTGMAALNVCGQATRSFSGVKLFSKFIDEEKARLF
jgi:hypothetical protein